MKFRRRAVSKFLSILVTIAPFIFLFISFFIIWLIASPKPAKVSYIPQTSELHERQEPNLSFYKKLHYSELMGLYSNKKVNLAETEHKESREEPIVKVWLQEQEKVEEVSLEQYVLAVALKELPLSFHKEAIKAQMLSIRTYIYRRFMQTTEEDIYHITNTTQHQVYKPLSEVQQLLNNEQYTKQMQKFLDALEETKGMIITYEKEPIDALFFSTSNGYTVDAQQYFGQEVPYLQSVPSQWDAEVSPYYKHEKLFTFEQVYTALQDYGVENIKTSSNFSLLTGNISEAKRLLTLQLNGQTITGRQLREALGLSSTDITWSINQKEEEVTFYTTGYGHGVGLSQWGAEGMARAGYTAKEIIFHYYTNVQLQHYDKLVMN